jgi:hypothetical protein
MKRVGTVVALVGALVLVSAPALADRCTRQLSRLQGYTVVAVTQVDGEFQGCDFSKAIRFLDGTVLKCSSYGYMYAYMPDAVIFAKQVAFQGKAFAAIKVLIEGEVFDMEPALLK